MPCNSRRLPNKARTASTARFNKPIEQPTKMPRIAIGSGNPVKIQAAQAVLGPLYPGASFAPLEVASGVRAQPWGDPETRTGAINRARAACAQSGADFGVGFEGGVVETEIGLMLCNWAAFYAADGRIGVGCGGGLLLPPQVADQLYAAIELGPAMDSLTGDHDTRRGEGAVGILTAGLVNRQAAFEYTLKLALAPFQTAHYYQSARALPGGAEPGTHAGS
jgi:inosine/xanthosine triphosphatase